LNECINSVRSLTEVGLPHQLFQTPSDCWILWDERFWFTFDEFCGWFQLLAVLSLDLREKSFSYRKRSSHERDFQPTNEQWKLMKNKICWELSWIPLVIIILSRSPMVGISRGRNHPKARLWESE
jgi:hypothetical protein